MTIYDPDFYPHPLDSEGFLPAYCWRDKYLRAFSLAARSKHNWTEKVLDRTIVAKWFRKAERADNGNNGRYVLSWHKNDVQFVYEELLAYRKFVLEMREQGHKLEPHIDCVWKADGAIPEELRQALIKAVATLENVPEEKRDWHPGSKKQVLNLVHPSMWPLVYDASVDVTTGEEIEVEEGVEEWDMDIFDLKAREGWSNRFCWLPSEFEVSEDGKNTTIRSYVNNLSSLNQQELFYPILERIFTIFVPLFNCVLADLHQHRHECSKTKGPIGYAEPEDFLTREQHDEKFEEMMGQFERREELTVDFNQLGKRPCYKHSECMETGADCGKVDYSLQEYQLYPSREQGSLSMSEIWSPPVIKEEDQLEGRTLKVIVKMANIVLTPENPSYTGGSWHVEAMLNERIVSTGIYYYAQENITESELGFRRTFQYLFESETWTAAHDLDSGEGRMVQEIGRIVATEGRIIAFPNVYQHQVQPFELVDKTKPGYRKILVFFLCEPHETHNMPTTQTVAPQQPYDREQVLELLRQSKIGQLPEEIFQLIVEKLPPVISQELAEEYRRQLIAERSVFNKESQMVQGRTYSLYETDLGSSTL
ncbi:hypothetical protein H072_1551 [Dactylellina haptotyla CBS 200.50]|uniref:Uncharacterized protein n=1 Tax=Dactylellina haptotyla (strain CBS 200.50) TaxID=1284197 RepID=S8AU22_DACHA|nr:hypothetical protein H072_1551 [Dactylellina haptotyla CBS 200.50]